jgi:hypothetical protein
VHCLNVFNESENFLILHKLIWTAPLSPVFIPPLNKYLFLGVHQRVYVYNSEHLRKNLELKYFYNKADSPANPIDAFLCRELNFI